MRLGPRRLAVSGRRFCDSLRNRDSHVSNRGICCSITAAINSSDCAPRTQPFKITLFGGTVGCGVRAAWCDVEHKRPFSSNGQQPLESESDSAGATNDTHQHNYELRLAQTGEGIAECEVLKWFVEEGQLVSLFQPVCQVQSDKATVDITSRYEGRITRIHASPGDTVKVGEILAEILSHKASNGDTFGSTVEAAPPNDPQGPHDGGALADDDSAAAETDEGPPKATLASPAVRHLARTYNVQLSDVAGSGECGRILKTDVLNYVSQRQAVVEEARMEERVLEGPEPGAHSSGVTEEDGRDGVTPGGGTTREAAELVHEKDREVIFRGYRRAMARRLAAAASIPHFTLMEEVRMDSLLRLKDAWNATVLSSSVHSDAGPIAAPSPSSSLPTRLTPLPILIKALSLSLLAYPELNGTYEEAEFRLHCRGSHNIGVAMTTPHGLVVPNIKGCQDLSVQEIAVEIARLRLLASSNKLPFRDVSNGTITVSNVGTICGTNATPLVNLPEVAIVALGRTRYVPRFDDDGKVVPASVMNVSWSADHRAIDGAGLANICKHWMDLVENPCKMMFSLA